MRSEFKAFPHLTVIPITATRLAWDGEYKGDLPRVLFDTIADYLSKDRNPKPYAMLTTVVNSSGTGKSRMVDQLGTEVVTVPMCLRREKNGFSVLLIFIKCGVFTI